MNRFFFNRRVVLGMLSIGAVPVLFGAYAMIGGAVRCAATRWDSGSLAAIGRSYLAMHPEEASTPRLVAELQRSTADVVAALRTGSFDDALDAARRDLARPNAEMVTCDGWLLGRAEARCAALVTLARGATGIDPA